MLKRGALLCAVFCVGLSAVITQTLLLREYIVVFCGNELSIGIALACWFVGVFVGALLSGRITDSLKRPSLALGFVLLGMLILPFLLVPLVRLVRALADVAIGQYASIDAAVVACLILTPPFSFFVGFAFPVASRLAATRGFQASTGIAAVYIVEALGGALGGALFTFVLCDRFRPLQIACLVGLAGTLGTLLLWETHGKRRVSRTVCPALFAAFLLFLGSGEVNRLDTALVETRWQTMSRLELLSSMDSRYQNIVVAQGEDQRSVFGNGTVLSSFPDEFGSRISAALLMTQNPRPRRILVVGEALSGLARQLLGYPIEQLDVVELDPELIRTTLAHLPGADRAALGDERMRVFACDGRFFVKASASERAVDLLPVALYTMASDKKPAQGRRRSEWGSYDLVFLNLHDPATAMINRFYTVEFFREVARILREDGTVALNIQSAENYFSRDQLDYTASIYRTLTRVFPYAAIAPGGSSTFFASRAQGIVTTDVETLRERYLGLDVEPRQYADLFRTYYQPSLVKLHAETLAAAREGPLNVDERPVSCFYYLRLWGWFAGGRLLTWLTRYWLAVIVIILGLVITIGMKLTLAARLHPVPAVKFCTVWAIGTTGFSALLLEMIIIFSYVNLLGYVYQRIGLIVALFMIGLAGGSVVMMRQTARSRDDGARHGELVGRMRLLLLFEALLVGFAGVIPLVVRALGEAAVAGASIELVLTALLVVAGFLTGIQFPLAARIRMLAQPTVGRTAGALDAADHLGAAAGGLLAGTFLVPLAGVSGCAQIVAVLNLTSILFLLLFLVRFAGTPAPGSLRSPCA